MVDNRGNAIPYSTGTTGRPIPIHDPLARPARVERATKPTGLDWDAHTPTCKLCETKSGRIDDTGMCPACRGTVAPHTPTTAAALANIASGKHLNVQMLDEHQLAEKFSAPTTVPPTIDPKATAWEKALEQTEQTEREHAELRAPVEGTPAYVKRLQAARSQRRAEEDLAYEARDHTDTTDTSPAPAGATAAEPPTPHPDPSPSGEPVAPSAGESPTRLPVRAKVRQASPDDIVITLRGAGLATRQTDIAALLQDLLAGLNTPVVAAPPVEKADRQPATTGTNLAPRTGKGKPARGASTTSQRGRTGGQNGTTGRLAGHDDTIVNRYKAGDSCTEIAATYDCTPNAIRYLLKRNGITLRTGGAAQIGKHKPTNRAITPAQDAEIATAYATGRYSMTDLGHIYGCSEHAIRTSLDRTNTPIRPIGTRKNTTLEGA